jgi:hypothetical protein
MIEQLTFIRKGSSYSHCPTDAIVRRPRMFTYFHL